MKYRNIINHLHAYLCSSVRFWKIPTSLLVEGVPELVEGVPELVEGVHELVEGVPEPVEGVPEPVEGVPELVEGVPELVEGVPELVEGSIIKNQFNSKYQKKHFGVELVFRARYPTPSR